MEDIDGVTFHPDDVTVHAPDKITHDASLLILFQRFNDKTVAINPRKPSFSDTSFKCLGSCSTVTASKRISNGWLPW